MSSENQSTPDTERNSGEIIEPVAFRPSSKETQQVQKRRIKPVTIVLTVTGLLLASGLWFVFSAKAVLLNIDPMPDSVVVQGGFQFELGGRLLLRKGEYSVQAEKQGYYPLEQTFMVGSDSSQEFDFDMKLLPGKLTIQTQPETVQVFVDGEDQGETDALELEKGEYQVLLRARGYVDYEETISIEGGSVEQLISADLIPAFAPITFTSTPAGADVSINEEVVGQTPLTTDVPAGSHLIALTRSGFKSWRGDLTVQPDIAQELETVVLERADGTISVKSTPTGASVTVSGRYYGITPIKLKLRPGSAYQLAVNKAGFQTASRTLDVISNEGQSISLNLKPNLGVIRFISVPSDADIYVNGELKGRAGKRLQLPAVEQEVEFRKAGYASYKVTVTPRPGFDQSVTAQLKTAEEAKWDAIPKSLTVAGDLELTLLRPDAQFALGVSRREAGRRANEALRPVALDRPFYAGLKEVTNAQYRQFKRAHISGSAANASANQNDRPVTEVTWEDAAKFCNWLSDQAGLPHAYKLEAGKMVAVEPMNNGYRLPTEAEWAWIARYAGKSNPSRFPWGSSLPPTEISGNYADESAKQLLSQTLAEYDDHFPNVAPVGSFAPNPLGFYDLSGNVSEWVHDYYVIGAQVSGQRQTNPLGPGDGAFRVIRGSSWRHGSPVELRWAYRDYGNDPRADLGFRVARYVE